MEITSTKDRIIALNKLYSNYSVFSEPKLITQNELTGWLVKTTLIINDSSNERRIQSSSFREYNKDTIYTALETADTVAFGRCLGKLGIGIELEFATEDEISSTPNKFKQSDKHDDALVAKLLIKNGDLENAAEKIVEIIDENIIEIPEPDKRDLRSKVMRDYHSLIKKLVDGNIEQTIKQYNNKYKTYSDFLRKASVDDLNNLINKLKKTKNED